MAKKSKPAAKAKSSGSSGGESNTGLIVTLVIFVLLTLTLGVFTYFGYDGQKEFRDQAASAKKDAATAKKAMDEEAAKRLVLAIATGYETPGDTAKLQAAKGSASAAYTAALESVKNDVAWDANQERPKETIRDKLARLDKEITSAKIDKKNAEQARDEAKAAFDSMVKSLNEKVAKLDADLKKAQNDIVEAQRKEREDYAKKIKEIDTQSEELKKEKQGRADDAAAFASDKKKLEGSISGLTKQLDVVKAQLTPPNSLEADTPKGRILRIDREQGLAYISLGSADYVKPNLTFSVMPPSVTGKAAATQERKGAIEISAVQGEHLSVARITEQVNVLRDPILAGDLIFNPSWNSSQREHVALAGIFDLDGDGRDDIQEVIRALERQGIVVDAYLDPADRTIKGPGITERTTYLVAGTRLELSESQARATRPEDNPLVQGVKQINEKIGELETIAREKGVQKVNYHRYLTLIGYPLPRTGRKVDPTSATYIGKPAAPAVGGEEKPK